MGPTGSSFLGMGPRNPYFEITASMKKEHCAGDEDPSPAVPQGSAQRGVDGGEAAPAQSSKGREGIFYLFTSSPFHPISLFPEGLNRAE